MPEVKTVDSASTAIWTKWTNIKTDQENKTTIKSRKTKSKSSVPSEAAMVRLLMRGSWILEERGTREVCDCSDLLRKGEISM